MKQYKYYKKQTQRKDHKYFLYYRIFKGEYEFIQDYNWKGQTNWHRSTKYIGTHIPEDFIPITYEELILELI